MKNKLRKMVVVWLNVSALIISGEAYAENHCLEDKSDCAANVQCCSGKCNKQGKCERTHYDNFPSEAKVKITRNEQTGKGVLELEFQWSLNCLPNFQKGKAVEFEINIFPKCFLRPIGGMDDKKDCDIVLGKNNHNFRFKEEGCYVDLWNYWNPNPFVINGLLEESCGWIDNNTKNCAASASLTGAFLDKSANFAVGVFDASQLKAGVPYFFRYPVEIDNSWNCRFNTASYRDQVGKQCTYLGENPRNDYGRAWVTMQTFNNHCDLGCSFGNNDIEYTCPELIGLVHEKAKDLGCLGADKHTDFWLNRLCVPTGQWNFTPGYGNFVKGACANEANSSDLATHNICCADRDGDGFFAPSGYVKNGHWVPVDLYGTGTQPYDCNDSNNKVSPNWDEVCGDKVDNNCNGLVDEKCNGGGGVWGNKTDPCNGDPDCFKVNTKTFCVNGECSPGKKQTEGCDTGGVKELTCSESCKWVETTPCPPSGCMAGATQPCGNCGVMSCGSDGKYGPCQNQGTCSPGQTNEEKCPDGQNSKLSTCSSDCSWKILQDCPSAPNCDCSSGDCCDGCKYVSADTICASTEEFQCAGDNPGDDVQRSVTKQFCPGNGPDCTGTSSQGPWLLFEDCSEKQKCNPSGQKPVCEGFCTETYVFENQNNCLKNTGKSGEPTLCLYMAQKNGHIWSWHVCKNTGSFEEKFKVTLVDENHSEFSSGTFEFDAQVNCSNPLDINLSYLDKYGYGSINGGGFRAEVLSPKECNNSSCEYHSGSITISRTCQ